MTTFDPNADADQPTQPQPPTESADTPDTETSTITPAAPPTPGPRVWRIEVHPTDAADDPQGASLLHEANELHLADGIAAARTARIYLIEAALDEAAIGRIADELLADPINQRFVIGATPTDEAATLLEIHYLPGVMDPVAQSTTDAIAELLGPDTACEVRTGTRYDLYNATADQADAIAKRLLFNAVIQKVETHHYHPDSFLAGSPYEFNLGHVDIRNLDDQGLATLSRDGHLFLSLQEMQGVRDYYREADRDPTDIELETLAQTWSEHCVHKTLKSKIRYVETSTSSPSIADFASHPNHTVNEDGSLNIDNLLKSTIAAATNELIEEGLDWCISIFVDNAGIIKFDETDAITFKVETHNHPSALEPYGGAATGIGGCIRDTMGTGLVAKPIASTDVFAVGDPNFVTADLPKGTLHPRRILKRVVAGIGEYGNRMGIPTVNGAVSFDNRYIGNPLVFAGSVGLIPNDLCFGDAQQGDRIIALGGRTGRDGIHGATFSSAELTDSHADEFSHAVQIGNAITEKKCLDVILQARDYEGGPLFTSVTDCGAGGFSSAIGEMGEEIGANVQLDAAPIKYEGLSYTEIWISEAQERMVMAVKPDNVAALQALCDAEDVELSDLGEFGTENAELILNYQGHEVGRLSMDFMHNGIPQPTREATWTPPQTAPQTLGEVIGVPVPADDADNIPSLLVSLLSHPNIASKHWIIRLYDHEVQGGSVVKPLTGVNDDGPSDAGVLRPKLDSDQAIALSCGLATAMGDVDPYWMTLAAIDEAIRNAVCVGARPDRIAILDNFCWPGCDKPQNLGSLVRASQACYHGAKAYKTPFVSGKDSLNNQFTTDDGQLIEIPSTLLISAVGIVDDANQCVTMDAKTPGNLLLQVGLTTQQLGGSHLHLVTDQHSTDLPKVDLKTAPAQLAAVAQLIAQGLVRAAHDCSEGGLLVAASEMAFAGRLGLDLDLAGVPRHGELTELAACFAENPTRILLEIAPDNFDAVAKDLAAASIPFGQVGAFNDTAKLTVRSDTRGQFLDLAIQTLHDAWIKPLDW